ncbi:MAG TPA: hypothetical protein DIT89_15865 [Planctomycetaceae bacterium]|nr:hypothetical protein [Planctomycetaceae bacterium]
MSAVRPLPPVTAERGRPATRTTCCPACGATAESASYAWQFSNARGETNWLRCSDCHSYFMDREYALESEVQHTEQMTWGDAEQGAQLNEFKERMYQSILGSICRLVSPTGRRLLDVGCAYGGFLKAAAAAGFDVVGYDIVPSAVKHVQKLGFQAQVCSRAAEFTLLSEPLDVVTVLDANIYWPDQPAELRQIFDRLKPGGLLVMRVVDKSWLATIGARLQQVTAVAGQKLLRRAVNDHRFSMPLGSMLGLLEQTGFRVISATPRGAIHSDHTSLPVKLSFGFGTALWHTLGVFLAPGAVVIAEKP